jgi:hypothetical protein
MHILTHMQAINIKWIISALLPKFNTWKLLPRMFVGNICFLGLNLLVSHKKAIKLVDPSKSRWHACTYSYLLSKPVILAPPLDHRAILP